MFRPGRFPGFTLKSAFPFLTKETVAWRELLFIDVTVNGAEKKYTVTLQGTFKDNTLTVNYSVQYGKMPAAMIGKFVCKK